MKKLAIIYLLLTFMGSAFASLRPVEIIENFDLRYYQPQLSNLKDLAFEIRISNLKENVLKSVPLSRLNELYYSIYWISPGRFYVEVNGLPSGYRELKEELKALIRSRLNYVLPEKLGPKIRSYSMKIDKSSTDISLIKGIDITHQRKINRIEMEFDKEGKLKTFVTRSPLGSERTEMIMSSKPWSKNKWVIDNVKVITNRGIQKTVMNNKMYYKNFDGFGFPEKVVVTTVKEMKLEKKKTKKIKISSEITFSNYKINSGIAKKKIMDISAKK